MKHCYKQRRLYNSFISLKPFDKFQLLHALLLNILNPQALLQVVFANDMKLFLP